MTMRPLPGIGLLSVGAFAGFAAATAVVKRALPSHGDPKSDEVALVAICDGVALRSRATSFRGGSMLAWLGGIAFDLRDAKLAPEAHLSVHAILGGIAIRVPPGWRIESKVHALGGGVAVRAPSSGDAEAPRLVLDGFALLGGVAVGARAADHPDGD